MNNSVEKTYELAIHKRENTNGKYLFFIGTQ